ncbi:MAG: methyltransferase domain-containing protein [Gemmatimonadaceae bacterium]|nr:methyltransferase domain-containing protein [Gemmatimonadaceae bacterium]
MAGTDTAWEFYGKQDPYYGVLSNDAFRKDSLDGDAKARFFSSGERYVENVLETVRTHLATSFVPASVLDFGCGVGRLALPLARQCSRVVGVDISQSMLAEARRNAVESSLSNVEFVQSDDLISKAVGEFDLVHSFIVFQHIPTARGEAIFRQLIARVRPGGVGVVHFTYANAPRTPLVRRLLTKAYERVPGILWLKNLVKRDAIGVPVMQMNTYDLNRLHCILQESGCHDVHTRFTEASHYNYPIYGAVLHFIKSPRDTTTHS